MLLLFLGCSGDAPTDSTAPADDTATTSACGLAFTVEADETIRWSIAGGDVAGVALLVDLAGYRFRLPQAGLVEGVEPRLPASGVHTTADLTLSATLSDGTTCDSAPQPLTLRPLTATTFDDPVTAVTIDEPADDSCGTLLLETVQPASSHLGDTDNDAAFRIRHPCTGLVLLERRLTPSDLSDLGLDGSGWFAEVSFLPPGHSLPDALCTDQGCFVAAMETVPNLVPGTLLYFDPRSGDLLGSQQTWTSNAVATADLHHGLRVVLNDEDRPTQVRSLGWTNHHICESKEGYTSAVRADVDLATAEVTDLTGGELNTETVSCDLLADAPYHFYGNALGAAELAGERGTCATFTDQGSNTTGGFLRCEVGGRDIFILQQGMNPLPIAPGGTAERWVMPQIDPFLHAVSLWQDPDTETVHLFLLTLGDPSGELEPPTVWSMSSSEVFDGVEQRIFATDCTYTFQTTGDPARHHGSVLPLDADTLLALFPRGDATGQAVLLDRATCQETGSLQTACGDACTSSDKRYPRWAHRLEGYPLSVTLSD